MTTSGTQAGPAHSSEGLEEALALLTSQQASALVGRVAGAIAHDANNLLMVAYGHLDSILDCGCAGDCCRQRVEDLLIVHDRLASMLRQISGAPVSKTASHCSRPGEVLERLVRLFGYLQRRGIMVSLQVPSSVPDLAISEDALYLIVSNLVLNSAEAMANGGTITISTGQPESDGSTASCGGDPVVIRVSDDGPGIPEADQGRVFELGWTSKGPGHGLGLFSVKHRLESVGGAVALQSRPGAGTTVECVIPACSVII